MPNGLYKPKVYTASKLALYQLWRDLRTDKEWSFVEWTASWPLLPEQHLRAEETVTEDKMKELWQINIRQVRDSDILLLYGRDTASALRGSLVETGAALGVGARVVAVGIPNTDEFTFCYHHLITRVSNLVEARNYIYRFTILAPRSHKIKKEEE
jgi:hypothetical protein